MCVYPCTYLFVFTSMLLTVVSAHLYFKAPLHLDNLSETDPSLWSGLSGVWLLLMADLTLDAAKLDFYGRIGTGQ